MIITCVCSRPLSELKKLDDKQMLTETHLTESRIYHSLQNIPKGKKSNILDRTEQDRTEQIKQIRAGHDGRENHCMNCPLELNSNPFSWQFCSLHHIDMNLTTIMCLIAAKASLTASRSAANAIYVVPLLQVPLHLPSITTCGYSPALLSAQLLWLTLHCTALHCTLH